MAPLVGLMCRTEACRVRLSVVIAWAGCHPSKQAVSPSSWLSTRSGLVRMGLSINTTESPIGRVVRPVSGMTSFEGS